MCGLRKLVNNCDFVNYLLSFDIIGLLETWGEKNNEFCDLLANYTCFDYVRTKVTNAWRNSGGIAAYVKNDLLKEGFISQICHNYQDCIVLYIKSSMYSSLKDIILYIAYVSPEGSPIYGRMNENNGITIIDSNISSLRVLYADACIYLAGDLNARTKKLLDYIPDDNVDNIFNIEVDYNTDPFDRPRNNKDSERYNNFGKTLVELCCTQGMHILNGRSYDDFLGNCTCLTNNGASVVDYHVVSTELFSHITYFCVEIRDESDHLPISSKIVLGKKKIIRANYGNQHYFNNGSEHLPKIEKYKWKDAHKQNFMRVFENSFIIQHAQIFEAIACTDIDEAIDKILNLYKYAASDIEVNYKTHS